MDRSSEIDEERVSTDLMLTGEQLHMIVKALDAYASVLLIAESAAEFEKVRNVAQTIINQFPREDFNS
jgi:hypothetical protein